MLTSYDIIVAMKKYPSNLYQQRQIHWVWTSLEEGMWVVRGGFDEDYDGLSVLDVLVLDRAGGVGPEYRKAVLYATGWPSDMLDGFELVISKRQVVDQDAEGASFWFVRGMLTAEQVIQHLLPTKPRSQYGLSQKN